MRRAALGGLVFAACAAIQPRIGGTPGPPAVSCAGDDPTCAVVRESLEDVRGNIGGWCGTPNVMAHEKMVELGPPAAGWIAAALTDRDEQVARSAAWALFEMGQGERVRAWCASHGGRHPRTRFRPASSAEFCRDLAAEIARVRQVDFTGSWRGELELLPYRNPPQRQPARLELQRASGRLAGQLCVADECVPVEGVQTGVRLVLEGSGVHIVVRTIAEEINLEIEGEYLRASSHRQGVARLRRSP